MQLECTNSEQNRNKTSCEKTFLSRLMQRNEGAMADVIGPVFVNYNKSKGPLQTSNRVSGGRANIKGILHEKK